MNDSLNVVLYILKDMGYILEPEDIHKSLFSKIGMDSLQFVQLIISIEEKYGFEFDDEDMIIDDGLTIQRILDIIKKHIS